MNFDKGRPENKLPPEIYYNKIQAKKYHESSRIIEVQREMSERAIELLNFPKDDKPRLILDLGCGSGISGECLTENGFVWVGCDISQDMLDIYSQKKTTERIEDDENILGDVMMNDIGQGLPFRIGLFDAIFSISCLQWLCTNYKKSENAFKRLAKLFSNCYSVIKKGGKAVFQFYPEDSEQQNMITKAATKAGFTGGVVIDFPNSTKARKFYLVLFSGESKEEIPKGITDEKMIPKSFEDNEMVDDFKERRDKNLKRKKKGEHRISIKEYIIKKKVRDRLRGRKTATNSKYTGRKRK